MRNLLNVARSHWLLLLSAFVAGLVLAALALLPQDLSPADARELFGVGLTLDLIRFGLGVVAVYLLLRLRDLVMNLDFKAVVARISDSGPGAGIYFGAWIIGLFLFAGSVLASPAPTAYDLAIERAVRAHLPTVAHTHGWQLYKAQLWQESRLEPSAVSPAGAAGIAQFMPATWREIREQLQFGSVSPHVAEYAIEAGAVYMAQLRRRWHSPRPEWDRHSLALASYNAGMGNLLRAQRICGGVTRYASIMVCLPDVTGRHAQETTDYAPRIWRWHALMSAGLL